MPSSLAFNTWTYTWTSRTIYNRHCRVNGTASRCKVIGKKDNDITLSKQDLAKIWNGQEEKFPDVKSEEAVGTHLGSPRVRLKCV